MLLTDKHVVIIGGGPGGLTLARLLQRHHIDVTVYERDYDEHARVQGGTLDLHDESGLAALRQAELMDAFMHTYRPGADRLSIVDKQANILLQDDERESGDLFRPEIDRGPLRQLLLNSLQPGTVRWNRQVISMTAVDSGWQLTFQDGSSATGDLVIGADGANSSIRSFLTPIKPVYSGLTIIEGTVPNAAEATPVIHALSKGGKIFALGDSKSLIVSSKGDGSLTFYTGSHHHENWYRTSGPDFNDREQVLAWFAHEFAGWSPVWRELIEQASLPLLPRPQYCMPLDQHWDTQPTLTVLGDAAHLMPPYAGEGVNMAMLDALQLSTCLLSTDYPDLLTAIASYESQMLTRFAQIGQLTLDQTASLHSPTAVSDMLAMLNQ